MTSAFLKTGGLYVPEKVTVGRFKYPGKRDLLRKWNKKVYTDSISDAAVVTCRFKTGGWLVQGAFERLTGYKPTNQQDRAAQLKKTVTNVVEEIRNEPVSGFKVERFGENLYESRSRMYDFVGDVVIRDPRGFAFPVSVQNFFEIMKSCGGNIKNSEFAGKFVYAWTDDTREMTLKKVDDSVGYSAVVAKKRPSISAGIKDSDLVEGKAYRASRVLKGDYVFVGIRGTYSGFCQQAAVRGGKYEVERFAEKEKWCMRPSNCSFFPTTTGKMVFYRLNAEPGDDPYVVRTSAAGIFSEEVEIPKDAVMHGHLSKPVTYENILADMARNVAFSKLDLSNTAGLSAVDAELLEEIFPKCRVKDGLYSCLEKDLLPRLHRTRIISKFPFAHMDWPSVFLINGKWLKILDKRNLRPRRLAPRRNSAVWDVADVAAFSNLAQGGIYGYSTRYRTEYRDMTCEEFVEKFSPALPALFFEDGTPVPEEQCAFLIPERIEEAAKQIF